MSLTTPVHGISLWLHLAAGVVVSAIVYGLLQLVPAPRRKGLIKLATFLGGLFYSVEFFWPVHAMPTKADPKAVGNFLTPFVAPVANLLTVVAAIAVGLGVINLFQIHGKRIARGGERAGPSVAFFAGFFAMTIAAILAHAHPYAINKNINDLLYVGLFANMDATVFSIVAFYIVSASYRAFRARTADATLLLVTAIIVMLGQVAVGMWLTSALPQGDAYMLHNLRLENMRNWILTLANTAVIRAISFGLGVGALAVGIRIWLGLERGSYFESQA